MSRASDRLRLVVIGAGPGGYPAAFLAAQHGLDVTLVDPEPNPGGVCLYRGCIPSKALLHVAALLHETRAASAWGLSFGEPSMNLAKLREWKDSVVARLTRGLDGMRRAHGVEHVRGRGTFLDAHRLQIEQDGGDQSTLDFDYAVVATGSRPAVPPALEVDSPLVMDSTAALELDDIPEHLLVVGGGYIGLELGSVYAALGAHVTVVEMTPGLLPGVDRDLVEIVQRRLRGDFEEILLNTRVVSMRGRERGVEVELSGSAATPAARTFDKVLVAVGRRPNSDLVGLENTAVGLDRGGFIVTDGQRRTTEASIFAVGDVAGEPMLAHKATHEARVAVEAMAGRPTVFEPQAIPAVVFTDPEIAWCGVTETMAKDLAIPVEIAQFPWAASGRAATLGRGDGLTKLVLEPRTARILGVGLAGPRAGDLIAEGVLAVESGALASDLQLSIHPHPTLSETLMEASDVFFGHSPSYIARPRDRRSIQ